MATDETTGKPHEDFPPKDLGRPERKKIRFEIKFTYDYSLVKLLLSNQPLVAFTRSNFN